MHFWKSLECIPHFFMHLGLTPIVLINQNIGNIHNSTHSAQMFWLFVHCNPPFKLCQLRINLMRELSVILINIYLLNILWCLCGILNSKRYLKILTYVALEDYTPIPPIHSTNSSTRVSSIKL